ncbi:MAG: hypothetical protein ACSHXB_20750 [Sulfitobacter sp.]
MSNSMLTAQDTVIPLFNDILKVQALLSATSSVVIPSQITSDASYTLLVNNFETWRQALWNLFWYSFLNTEIVSEVSQIKQIFATNEIAPVSGDIVQSECNGVFFGGSSIAKVQTSCVALASEIGSGQDIVSDLTSVIDGFQKVDRAKVAAALSLVNTLNSQFSEQEQELNQDMFAADEAFATTAVNVSIAIGEMALGDEAADPITPLIEGVTQIANDVGKALLLTGDIQDTLNELEAALTELSEDEYQLMQLMICKSQLDAVTTDAGPALSALARIEVVWSNPANLTTAPVEEWNATGATDLANWAEMAGLLGFVVPTAQNIQPSGSGAWTIAP